MNYKSDTLAQLDRVTALELIKLDEIKDYEN
jgi:hypothetical protein